MATGSRQSASNHLANSALRLLQFEAQIRAQSTEADLKAHMSAAPRELVAYEQGFFWQKHYPQQRLQLAQISDLDAIETQSPLIKALGDLVNHLDVHQLQKIDLTEHSGDALQNYPYQHLLWLPLEEKSTVQAGLLYARQKAPFSEQECSLLERLADTYQHAWLAVSAKHHLSVGRKIQKRWLYIVPVVIFLLGFFPVQLNILAPVNVQAHAPYRLTAPMDGVIKDILVDPNVSVTRGTPLVQFEDLELRNAAIMASQQLQVAKAKLTQTNAHAFDNMQANHELPIREAEFKLAQLQYQYAQEQLAHTQINAPQNGLVIYNDKRDWQGKAVQVGEQILEVADPQDIQFRIRLAVGNDFPLETGQAIKVYLVSSPLGGFDATLKSFSYTPRSEEGQSYFTLIAIPSDHTDPPRIGAQGTARIYSHYVPLWYQLLRRPLGTIRQWLGV